MLITAKNLSNEAMKRLTLADIEAMKCLTLHRFCYPALVSSHR
jgi:hypothetical protein